MTVTYVYIALDFFLNVLIHDDAYLLLAMRSGELHLEYYFDCFLTLSAKQL